MIRILFICHANICRSPMAEFICKDIAAKKDMEDRFEISSAAVSNVKAGEAMHPACFEQLIKSGINQKLVDEMRNKRARKFSKDDYTKHDLILVMDHKNREHLRFSLGEDLEDKIHFLSKYAKLSGDIEDPWETGDFQKAFEQIQICCKELLEELTK